MWKLTAATKVPIFSWADPETFDQGTKLQIVNLANLPFAFHHVALMADAHVGYGMPIGGILASKDYLVPNAVGVDIGCGMVAEVTNLKKEEFFTKRENIGVEIFTSVPVGFKKHKAERKHELFARLPDLPLIGQELKNIKTQMGTLGGGNHFIDILYDSNSRVWLMVHSGSRHLGHSIAGFYHKKAVEFSHENFKEYPDNELAALAVESELGQEYLTYMKFAQQYAFFNRQRMLKIIKRIIDSHFPHIKYEQEINIHHNFANLEEHFGQKVWVHRKGAISANKDEWGIIPGSMGTHSHMTSGFGNPDSFNSASHGSGREIGRREAKRKFNMQDVEGDLAAKDVKLYKASNAGAIEEFTRSYKNIESIIELQKDLVTTKFKLFPMLVVIG